MYIYIHICDIIWAPIFFNPPPFFLNPPCFFSTPLPCYHLIVTCVLHLNLEELQAIHTMYVLCFLIYST